MAGIPRYGDEVGQKVKSSLAAIKGLERRVWVGKGLAALVATALLLALVFLARAQSPGLQGYLLGGLVVAIVGFTFLFLSILDHNLLHKVQRLYFGDLLKTQRELWQLAIRDDLTHLYNRRYFLERFEEELEAAQLFGRPLALVLADADNLKAINDTYGHRVGDEVLAQLGKALAQRVRLTDIAARIGGDEFAILMPHTGREGALALVGRLRREVVSRVNVEDRHQEGPLCVTLSFGVAAYPEDGQDPDALLQRADAYLYRTKGTRSANASPPISEPEGERS